MDDDNIIDDEQLNNDLQPIDGQIGIEELYVRGEEEEQEEIVLDPIDGQFSFEDILDSEEATKKILSDRQQMYENEEIDFSKEQVIKLSEFFKGSEFEKEMKEKEELGKFFEDENTPKIIESTLDVQFLENESITEIGAKESEIEGSTLYLKDKNNEDSQIKYGAEKIKEHFDYVEESSEDLTFVNDNLEKEIIENNDKAKEEFERNVKINEENVKDEIEDNQGFVEENENFDSQDLSDESFKNINEELSYKPETYEDINDGAIEKEILEESSAEFENIEENLKSKEEDILSIVEEGNDKLEKEENKVSKDMETKKRKVVESVKVKVNKNVKLENKDEINNERFFVNDENSQMIDDVNEINRDIKDVDVNVGKNVFGEYSENSSIKTNVNIVEKIRTENSGSGDIIDGMLYKNLDTVLHESMIPYSEHVILDRALPRVEDGLKPVQRRILYSMMELGVTPDKPFRKSARIVGDCLGKYHPHGDKSVYDAMVRMAQPFNTNVLLVNGHGNFGSVDGDGAAAMRYTEARLAPLAMELLRDLEKNTVKWGLNFDDTLKEPEILPGRFPNLLVNGSTGIAVGLATNIPPHNLAEVIDGVVAYINNPNISLKEMLKIIKGPDFPTGGVILSHSELNQAYETGKGKVYMRAKIHIENEGADKKNIVITEFPYQVNKSTLLQKIASYREENKYNFGDISEIRDESDREGIRAVIKLKKDADVKAIYEALLKNTELQTTFGINMVAIANGKPKQMSLMDIISYYSEYQREIIFRRSKYDLEQAKEREHILSGLIIAIKNIDAVVKIIKTSQNTTDAKKRLREKFNLSERQAQAILDMRLARLTSLEVYKLEAELKKLRELIKELTAIINSKKLQFNIVKEELLQIKKQYKTERKSRISKTEEKIELVVEPKQPVSQNVIILKSAQGNFKCVNLRQYNYAQKEVNENNTLFDIHTLKIETETTKTLLAFSNFGNCFKVNVEDFSESRYRDKGCTERTIFKELHDNETIVAIFDNEETVGKDNLIFLTKQGMIKKTAFSEYGLLKKYFQGMKLKDDDEIISIVKEPSEYSVVFVTKTGMVLNAESSDIPLQGRISGGVKGINLSNGDYCVGADLCCDAGEVLAVTDKGYAKRVLVANIDKMARYRKGLKFINFAGDNGKSLLYAKIVTNPFVLCCIDNENILHYRNTDLIPIEARIGKGKPVEKMKKTTTIVKSFAINN